MRVREVVQNTPGATHGSRLAKRVGRRWRVEPETSTGTVLIVRHELHTPGAALIDARRGRSLEPRILEGDGGVRLPDPRSFGQAVVLGSGPTHRAGQDELDWLQRADAAGTPVLALGSAAGRLAAAFGGAAAPASRPRRAWIGLASAVPELVSPGPWLAGEDEIVDLPHAAEVLAEDHLGPQAFRVGHHLDVQFNPHATPETVREWLAGSAEVLDHQGILEASWRDHPGASEAARRFFTRFVASVTSRT